MNAQEGSLKWKGKGESHSEGKSSSTARISFRSLSWISRSLDRRWIAWERAVVVVSSPAKIWENGGSVGRQKTTQGMGERERESEKDVTHETGNRVEDNFVTQSL